MAGSHIMSDFNWDDDLFDDDEFMEDDSFDDDEEEVKPSKKKKEKPAKKKGGLFGKKKQASKEEDSDEDNFEDDLDEEGSSSYDDSSYDDTADGMESDEEDMDDEEDSPRPSKPTKKTKGPRDHVHGLKKKGSDQKKGSGGKIAAVVLVAAAVVAAGFLGSSSMNGQIKSLKQSNQNLTDQIASQSMNVYTAKRDIQKGDEIITSGDNANVELSQLYTSLPETEYISEATTWYAQVDIKAGEPVMTNTIGDTNPVSELNDAIAAVKAENSKAKVMPYKITADFVDLNTGNTLAESRDLLLDSGANEKAFNTEAETIDGYVLKSIQVDKESVHAYGVSEKSMKEGIVTMYYFTTKGGWGRHEIKGNIRVTYGYVKKDDPSLQEAGATDVMDDSAWIQTEEKTKGEADAPAEANTEETAKEDAAKTASTNAVAPSAKAAKVAKAAPAKNQQAAKQQETAAPAEQAPEESAAQDTASETAEQTTTMSAPDDAGVSVETETIGLEDVG